MARTLIVLLLKKKNIKRYHTIISKGVRVIGGQFHIQNINGYMSRLRGWMRMMDTKKDKYKDIKIEYLINENLSFPMSLL
jgi:hypothetical protein